MKSDSPRQSIAIQPLGDHLIIGAVWMIAMRWSLKVIGLANTLILVRLLTPEDFGLVAMAMIVVAFVNAINDMGLDMALIRKRDIYDSYYDTAWTISVAFGIINSAIIVFAAPYVASFYSNDRLAPVMYTMALLPFINSLMNPKLADYRREFLFSKEFTFHLISRIIALPLSIAFAVYLRNHWALVAGMLAQASVALLLGYAMRPYRPRFSLSEFRELFSFSIWIQVRTLGITLSQRLDQLVVGKISGEKELGGYQVSQDISTMATMEVVLPLSRALLPGYATIQGDIDRLSVAFFKVYSAHVILAMAISGGLVAIAKDLIPVVLGAQWVEFREVFQLLVIAGGMSAISSASGPVLVALGRVRIAALSSWIRTGFMAIGLSVVVIFSGGLVEIAFVRVLVSFAMLPVLLSITVIALKTRADPAIGAFFRPSVATTIMAATIIVIQSTIDFDSWIRLMIEIAVGAVVFAVTLLGLWRIAGQPEGIEHEVVSRVLGQVRRMKKRLTSNFKTIA